jgi:hypothetical protein
MIASFLASQIVKKRRINRMLQQEKQEQQKPKIEKFSKNEHLITMSQTKKSQLNGKFLVFFFFK